MTPRFSITVPAYNATATLPETVDSVREQTFGDWELVIVDDGSTDDTLAMARDYASLDPRIKAVTQENRGTGGAYNTAVRSAKGDLLVMLSADDLLLPNHLEVMDLAIAEHPDAGIYSSSGYFEYEDGTRVPAASNAGWADPLAVKLPELLAGCFFGIGAVYRRAVWEAQDGFPERTYAEDYAFWLMGLAHGFTHRYVPEALWVHRRNSVQKSADAIRMRQADLAAVTRMVDSGLLTGDDLRTAEHAAGHFRRVILARKLLAAALGADLSTRLVDRLRGRKPVGARESD